MRLSVGVLGMVSLLRLILGKKQERKKKKETGEVLSRRGNLSSQFFEGRGRREKGGADEVVGSVL